MSKSILFTAILLSVAALAPVPVRAQEDATSYVVKILDYGGQQYEELGPFATQAEAYAAGGNWLRSHPTENRHYDVRAIKLPVGKFTPVARILADGMAKIDDILRKTRKVYTVGVSKIPSAGEVLNEYRKNVEHAWELADEAKKGVTGLIENGNEKAFAAANKAIDDQFRTSTDLFLAKNRLQIGKLVADDASSQASNQSQPVNDLLNRIAATKDPAQQKELIQKLQGMQKSGELRTTIIKVNRVAQSRLDIKDAEKRVDDLQQILDAGRKQQERILALLETPVKKDSFSGTIWIHRPGGSTRPTRLTFGKNGIVLSEMLWFDGQRTDDTNRLAENFEWRQEGENLSLRGSRVGVKNFMPKKNGSLTGRAMIQGKRVYFEISNSNVAWEELPYSWEIFDK